MSSLEGRRALVTAGAQVLVCVLDERASGQGSSNT